MTPHRERAIAWAQSIVNNPTAVYLDLETTGLGDDAEICDIAIVEQDGTVLLNTLVRPAQPIPTAAATVHGITDEMVIDAPEFWTVSGEISTLLRDRTVVVYNAPYDSKIINTLYASHGLPPIVCDWQDALKAYSDFDGTPGKYPNSRKWWKLSDAAARFGIEPGTHRALADTLACRLVVHAMASYTEPERDIETLFRDGDITLNQAQAIEAEQRQLFAVETPGDAERWRR